MIWSSGAWGDYDNDGKLDAMIMGYDPVAQVPVSRLYRNLGGNAFADSGQTFHNLYLGTLSWVDYDNDGNLDLLLAGNNAGANQLILYHNNNSAKNTVPGAPAGLVATNFGPNISFYWSAAADPQMPPAGLGYNLRVGTAPGAADVLNPESGTSGTRRVVALGNAGSRLTAQLNTLRPGTNYYCAGYRHRIRGRAVCCREHVLSGRALCTTTPFDSSPHERFQYRSFRRARMALWHPGSHQSQRPRLGSARFGHYRRLRKDPVQ